MKKSMKITLILIVILLFFYIIQCLYISFKINKIVTASYNSYGETNDYKDIISDNIFNRLCYRNKEHREYNDIYEQNWNSFPITFILFNRAYSKYRYTYVSTFNKGWRIPVTIYLEFKNFKWVIIEKHENP